MNFLGFLQSAELDVVLDNVEDRKMVEVKMDDGRKEKQLLFYDGETISGRVRVSLRKPGQKLEHHGIKIELLGQIELYYDRGNHYEFLSMGRELARPGDLLQNTEYPFSFPNVEKPYEVYAGSNVRLRYFLRITVVRRISDLFREIDICVHTLSSYPESNNPIKMEVGIEDCLHIEFEYNKSKYHLKDVIVGKIYFLLVRIKIKHMEIAIIKREQTGTGPQQYTESDTIAKYEIMDGAPVKGESIPIRVFLAGYDLTPTMRDINKKFSVKYFLNLVLMDTEDRRYFKQQEITLWRKAEGVQFGGAGAVKARPQQMAGGSGGAAGGMGGVAAGAGGGVGGEFLGKEQVDPHVPRHLVGSEQNTISSVNNGAQLPSERFHQQQQQEEQQQQQNQQRKLLQEEMEGQDEEEEEERIRSQRRYASDDENVEGTTKTAVHVERPPVLQSPVSPEEEIIAEGVNRMGLFTEDLEKSESNARGQATIVEGPVSPQTPTSPTTTQSAPASESVPASAAAATKRQEVDDSEADNAETVTVTARTTTAAVAGAVAAAALANQSVPEDDDDDDDLFKGN